MDKYIIGRQPFGRRCEDAQHILGQHRPIKKLPDNVLLEVFDAFRYISQESWDCPWKWNTLAHVCRSWRYIIFSSPRRLDLWLLCTHRTPVRKALDCWPALPIVINYSASLQFKPPAPEDEDNVVAALEHPDRVRAIHLAVTSSLWERVVTLMQVPFPALTSLSLWMEKGMAPAPDLPITFLGGSAPRLTDVSLIGVSFPKLPNLLLTTIDLVSLRLLEVPDSGYIPPHVMATSLSALIDLKVLCIEFHSPTLRHDQARGILPPLIRATLPALTRFHFRGASDYLEDLVARIDAPLLSHVNITFFNQLIFQVPHLSRFIGRMEMLKSAKVAEMESSSGSGVSITLDEPGATQRGGGGTLGYLLSLRVSCGVLDWQISSMAQICSQSSLLSGVEHLDIRADYPGPGWQDDEMDSSAWLELFHSFTSVERLSVSGELGPHVAPALEVVVATSTVAEVLPRLLMLHFECSRKSAPVENFVAARKESSRPVVVRHALFPCVCNMNV